MSLEVVLLAEAISAWALSLDVSIIFAASRIDSSF